MTEVLDRNLANVKQAILKKDMDFLLVITGAERVGKSSLALHTATTIQPDFSVEQVVFDIQTLYEQVYKLKPGSVVIIDEGATAFFSRDAMSGDVKDGVKLLTVMGERNLFVIICVPSFFILDKYIREYRVSGVAKVIDRGKFRYYSRPRLKKSFQGKTNKRFSWKSPVFEERFPAFTGKIWNEYTAKKAEYLAARKAPRLEEGNGKKFVPIMVRAKKEGVSRDTMIRKIQSGEIEGHKNMVGRWVCLESEN